MLLIEKQLFGVALYETVILMVLLLQITDTCGDAPNRKATVILMTGFKYSDKLCGKCAMQNREKQSYQGGLDIK